MTYIHRLPGGATKRGLDVLIRDDNPHLLAYLARFPISQCLYIKVVDTPERLVKRDCVWRTRDWSPMYNVNVTYLNRLLTVRNDWSKK